GRHREAARRAHRGGRYREAARRPRREGGATGAGDNRRLVDREGEVLGGVAADAVGGGEGQGVRPAAPRRRGAAERGRAVAVVNERHAAGQGARLAQARGRDAGGRHREAARRAHREGGAVGAGDERRIGEVGEQQVGNGAANASHLVIANSGGEPVVAGGDVVEVGGVLHRVVVDVVEHRQGLGGPVQCCTAAVHALL